jgi:hypothetical protein
MGHSLTGQVQEYRQCDSAGRASDVIWTVIFSALRVFLIFD